MCRTLSLTLVFFSAQIAGCVSPPPQLGMTVDMPIETSIQAVRADPAQFEGKYIAVRGVLDECTAVNCNIRQIKPGENPRDDVGPAISVTFKMAPGPATAKPDADIMSLSGALANRLFRFSEVTAVGLYAATCDSSPKPPKPAAEGEREEITVCSQRTGDFKVARVLTVHKRWPATAFGGKSDGLVNLSPMASKALFAAYIRAILAVNPESDLADWKPPYRAFALNDEPDSAILCICRGQQCDNDWPNSVTGLVSAPANPYGCVEAARAGGGWRFAPPSIEY